MKHAPLAEVTRGKQGQDSVECTHVGSVAVVNTRGDVLYQAGDPHFLTFTRSTIKPFQAMPFLRADARPQLKNFMGLPTGEVRSTVQLAKV